VLVLLLGTVVEVALVQHHPDQTVLPRGFRVLDGLEPELMVDVPVEEDVVEEVVLLFGVSQFIEI
jgi:hypothetical protein